MSHQITTALINQFKDGIYITSQQKGSRFQDCVRNESQKGVTAFYDQIGSVVAQARIGRHADTQYQDTPHSRRSVTMADYEWADLIDDQDKIRLLNDPTSAYQMAAVMAFGRKKDDVIISALGGTSYTGVTGSVATVLPTTQKIAAVASNALSNINIETLRLAKYTFDKADIDPDEERYFGITSSQLRALLAQTEITSADYANVKALVEGRVDTFLGFRFKVGERFALESDSSVKFNVATGLYDGSGTVSTGRKCYAWVKSGIVLATGMEMQAKIDVLPTKGYSTQVYARMSLGASRLEEVKVIEVHCKE